MPLKLMYITNREDIALIAESSGVDWIFIDLELRGKPERQGHLDTVISRHHFDDVPKIKKVLTHAKLLVRVNPLYEGTREEVNRVIGDGADIVMLPFFKTAREVETFIGLVNGRAKTCLLCETPEAVEVIDEIIDLPGIDFIHIGLNDLHLGYGMKFMFELLADGTVEMLCRKFRAKGMHYGFGGVARLGQGALPAEMVLAEHYRLGSSQVILARSFCNTEKTKGVDEIAQIFKSGVDELKSFEASLSEKDPAFFEQNQRQVAEKIREITRQKS